MSTENKKIINATEVTVDSIKFKSKLEALVYKTLTELGYNVEHEAHTFVLWEGFKPKVPCLVKVGKKVFNDQRKIRNITYTPDFCFEYKGIKVIIEAKGMMNDVFPLKFKLFRGLIEQQTDAKNYFIAIVYTKKQLLGVLKDLEEYASSSQNKKSPN